MEHLRLSSAGRGTGYHPLRGALESAMRLAYSGDWPARLWGKVPWASRPRVVRLRVPLLPPGISPLRVGLATDLHIGPTTPPELLEAAFDVLDAAMLDVLLLGGDYVFLDVSEQKAATLSRLVSRVRASRKLAVLGNHDLWTEHGLLEDALREAGAHVLVNDGARADSDGRVVVAGLDDPWTGEPDARRAFRAADAARADLTLALCHSPDGLPFASAARAELCPEVPCLYLCGHTHGGHASTPWGPVIVPGTYGKRYPFGAHEYEGMRLFVSRGLGATELPVRTYAPPEVVVIDLVSRHERDDWRPD